MIKGHSLINDRVKTKLIKWCIDNNKMIYDVPAKDKDGKIPSLYTFILYLKRNVNNLTKQNIMLLNKYGMIWEDCLVTKARKRVTTRRINNELIPWCFNNKKKICEIPCYLPNGKSNALYGFVCYLRNNVSHLNEEQIAILNKYGMEWATNYTKTIDERVKKYVLAWHYKTGIPLKDMPSRSKNGCSYTAYIYKNYIMQHKDELSPEIIEELDRCGMCWEINLSKSNKSNTCNNNENTYPLQ